MVKKPVLSRPGEQEWERTIEAALEARQVWRNSSCDSVRQEREEHLRDAGKHAGNWDTGSLALVHQGCLFF